MSIVSHLHHLFNAETCQSSIHTLRWKDRPLQCPRCQSHNVDPWGAYPYGQNIGTLCFPKDYALPYGPVKPSYEV